MDCSVLSQAQANLCEYLRSLIRGLCGALGVGIRVGTLFALNV